MPKDGEENYTLIFDSQHRIYQIDYLAANVSSFSSLTYVADDVIVNLMATVFNKIYWSILQTSVIICLIICSICGLASEDFLKLIVDSLHLRGHASLFLLRENLLIAVKDGPAHFLPLECFKFTLKIVALYGKQILITATIINLFPSIKGVSLSDAPTWVADISDRVQQSLSTEDLEPPELDLDHAAALIREKCYAFHSTQLVRNDCSEEMDVHADSGGGSADSQAAQEEPASLRRRNYQQASESDYVFDPVVGVILRETRDLWRESIKLTEEKLCSALSEKKQVDHLPAVGEESAPAVMVPLQKRALPPVRFSIPSIP